MFLPTIMHNSFNNHTILYFEGDAEMRQNFAEAQQGGFITVNVGDPSIRFETNS